MANSAANTPNIDPSERLATYKGVMKFSAEFGVPFCLAIAMFFTTALMKVGFFGAVAAALVVYVATVIIVKMFFSH